VSSNLAGCARHCNDLTRLRPTLTRQSTLRPISEAPRKNDDRLRRVFGHPPILSSAAYRCVNEPPPPHSSRARESPTAPTRPPAGSPGPSADSRSLGAPAGTGGRGLSPQPGGMGPYRARVPVADKRRRRATPNIRSQDLGAPQVMPYSPSPCVPQFHRPSVQAHPPGYSRQYPGVKVAPLVG
jgi:hypothetical protein